MRKKISALVLALAITVSIFPNTFAESPDKAVFYVAVDGNDKATGTEERPLATLEGARAKVRETLDAHPEGIDIEVVFKSGTYRFSETVNFEIEDSALDGHRITYRGDGDVYFKGSTPLDITKISLVTDRNIINRLPTVAKGKVGQLDLSEQGIDAKKYNPNLSYDETEDYAFFLNNKMQICAEWPNGDGNYTQYQTVLKQGNGDIWTEGAGGIFKYEESNPNRWADAKDLFVVGYLDYDYCPSRVLVKKVDTENQTIELAYGTVHSKMLTSYSRRWKAVNLLEEIDVPGEWYIDRDKDILYYYPESSLNNAEFEMSTLDKYFIYMKETKNVTFKDINFSQSRQGAIRGSKNIENVIIDGCTFTYLGNNAIWFNGSGYGTIVNKSHELSKNTINGAKDCLIANCTFAYLRRDGIRINGGNRDTLTPSGNIIENNYFYQCADKYHMYYYGIKLLNGCGDIVRNNVMNNFQFHCIDYTGNEYRIFNNELYNANRENSDCGIIYTGRSFTERGTEIAYNYIHDSFPLDERVTPSNNGVYLDDNIQGQIVHHNIFYNVHRGICANGSTDHQIYSNIFVDTPFATHLNNHLIGAQRNRTMYSDISDHEIYREAYPNIADIAVKYNGEKAAFNVVKDNVGYNANFTIYDEVKEYGTVENNILLDSVADFVDYGNKDFRLKESGDTVLDSSFDMNQIGLKVDEETGEFTVPKLLYSDFQQVYPKNGESGISYKDVYFRWDDALGADKYRLVIAKDKELTDVVFDGEVDYNYYTISELDPDVEKYYWKVWAINYSRQLGKTWESDNAVFSFNLNSDYELDKTGLEKELVSANEILRKIVEGDEVGLFKSGSKATLEALISDGEKLMSSDRDSATQSNINDCVKAINDFINNDDLINFGFYNLGKHISQNENWGKAEVISEDGKEIVRLVVNDSSTTAGNKEIYDASRNSVFCFKMRGSFLTDKHNWIGIGLRGDCEKGIYENGNDDYFLAIKEQTIELQRNAGGATIIQEIENTSLDFGKWHDVEFGVINLGTAQMIVLNVDGKNVFRYTDDSTSQIKKKGEFLIYATPGHSVELAPAGTVSSKSDYDALIKNGYDILQQKYFETVKTISDNSIMMRVNCKNYVTDAGVKAFSGGIPVIYGGKTLVPLRTISEFFDAEVNWDENSRSALIESNGKQIEFFENKNVYTVNGEEKELQQAPIIQNNTLLVPLRDASETIGKEVYWYDTGLIIIGTNQKVDTPNKHTLFQNISMIFEKMNDYN